MWQRHSFAVPSQEGDGHTMTKEWGYTAVHVCVCVCVCEEREREREREREQNKRKYKREHLIFKPIAATAIRTSFNEMATT